MYSCGAWSPSRAAVLFIGRTDGLMDIWDLLDRSHEPSMTIPVSPTSITSMEFLIKGNSQLLAVGDDQGTVHVLEVPRNLRRAANNEKAFAQNFFVREEQRVEYIQRAAESGNAESGDGKADGAPPAEPKEGEPTPAEKLEMEFTALEEVFMEEMGLNVVEEEPAPADE